MCPNIPGCLLLGLLLSWAVAQPVALASRLRHLKARYSRQIPHLLLRATRQTPQFLCWASGSPRGLENLPCTHARFYRSTNPWLRPGLKVGGAFCTEDKSSTRVPSSPAPGPADPGVWDEIESPFLSQVDRFVLFGDLHVSDATLNTCLDALALVQQTCKRHSNILPKISAGPKRPGPLDGSETPRTHKSHAVAVFLGDFWHSRVERHLHWGLLRPLLEFWEQWDVPVSS